MYFELTKVFEMDTTLDRRSKIFDLKPQISKQLLVVVAANSRLPKTTLKSL